MSLTDASMRPFFEAEDNFQNKGSVVDMSLDFFPSPARQLAETNFSVSSLNSVCYALLRFRGYLLFFCVLASKVLTINE